MEWFLETSSVLTTLVIVAVVGWLFATMVAMGSMGLLKVVGGSDTI